MARDELKTAFLFISDTLDDIYDDVHCLEPANFMLDYYAKKKCVLDKILTLANFANKYLNRLDSKEKI